MNYPKNNPSESQMILKPDSIVTLQRYSYDPIDSYHNPDLDLREGLENGSFGIQGLTFTSHQE